MTDEQFKQLMEKLEAMEKAMKAGTWWPQPSLPAYQPQPYFTPAFPAYPILTD